MATPTIPNGEEYFFPIIYEGNGAGQRVGKFVPFTDNGTIDNSLIFNDDDDAYLARTFSTPTNNKKWTYSVWIKRGNLGTNQAIMSADYDGASYWDMRFNTSNQIYIQNRIGSSNILLANTTRTFEDTSKWYHLVFVYDSDNSTSTSRAILYIDGDIQTLSAYPSSGDASAYNVNSEPHHIGVSRTNSTSGGIWSEFDGYFAEANFVDGQALTPSTFGLTDTSTGRWIPKALTGITYGTNGFRLKFQDSSALGDDTSGNGNDFTATNLASTDQTTDSPTQNHCIMDPNDETGSITMSEGNLKITQGGAGDAIRGSLAPTSGKYYFEITATATGADGNSAVGIQQKNVPIDSSTSLASVNAETFIYRDDGYIVNGGQSASGYTNWTQGNVIGIAMDLDNHKLYFSVNGTYINSGNPANGTGSVFNLVQNTRYAPYVVFQGSSGFVFDVNTGQRAFSTAAPTGFSALQQDNLPETAKGISGLVWTKNRDSTDNHQLYDSSRGKQLVLTSNTTDAESTVTDGLQRFLAGGQQIEDNVAINTAAESFVSWNWVANSGSTSSNTDGSITSTVQANTTAGFSIVQYTGTGSAATVGHGLSSAPEWFIVKGVSNSDGWVNSHIGLTSQATYSLSLNNTNAEYSDAGTYYWNSTAPTSSVFSIATDTAVNGSGRTYVAYCWHSVDGFSKFGKYTGNGNADGTFVYTGFKPAFLMIKSSSHAVSWYMFDNKRNPINPAGKRLVADGTFVEDAGTTEAFDFLSNGFKLRNASTGTNGSGYTMLYMAFAEHPFVGDGTSPVTAR